MQQHWVLCQSLIRYGSTMVYGIQYSWLDSSNNANHPRLPWLGTYNKLSQNQKKTVSWSMQYIKPAIVTNCIRLRPSQHTGSSVLLMTFEAEALMNIEGGKWCGSLQEQRNKSATSKAFPLLMSSSHKTGIPQNHVLWWEIYRSKKNSWTVPAMSEICCMLSKNLMQRIFSKWVIQLQWILKDCFVPDGYDILKHMG